MYQLIISDKILSFWNAKQRYIDVLYIMVINCMKIGNVGNLYYTLFVSHHIFHSEHINPYYIG